MSILAKQNFKQMHKDCVIIFVFILFSFFFLQQLLCISLVSLFSRYSAQILLEMPYSAGRMLASKNAYSARNSAGRIYPNRTVGGAFFPRVLHRFLLHGFPRRAFFSVLSSDWFILFLCFSDFSDIVLVFWTVLHQKTAFFHLLEHLLYWAL